MVKRSKQLRPINMSLEQLRALYSRRLSSLTMLRALIVVRESERGGK